MISISPVAMPRQGRLPMSFRAALSPEKQFFRRFPSSHGISSFQRGKMTATALQEGDISKYVRLFLV